SLLALKLTGTRRVSHVDDLIGDPASALFAGLAVLPKKSALTDHSCRLAHDHQQKFLAALDIKMISAGLATASEAIFDLDFHAVKFATLRMRSASLMKYINGLASTDYKTVTLDRPGPYNRPRVHEDPAVTLTSYPGTVRQLIVTGLGRDAPTVIITNDTGIKA